MDFKIEVLTCVSGEFSDGCAESFEVYVRGGRQAAVGEVAWDAGHVLQRVDGLGPRQARVPAARRVIRAL